MKVIFDSDKMLENGYLNFEISEEIDYLFNNEGECKSYILGGEVGRWDGRRKACYHKVVGSLKEAYFASVESWGECSVRVVEEPYGRLFIEVSHHDGFNRLEIRELTDLGEEMDSNWKDVVTILNRKGATRNVKYTKRYKEVL